MKKITFILLYLSEFKNILPHTAVHDVHNIRVMLTAIAIRVCLLDYDVSDNFIIIYIFLYSTNNYFFFLDASVTQVTPVKIVKVNIFHVILALVSMAALANNWINLHTIANVLLVSASVCWTIIYYIHTFFDIFYVIKGLNYH